MLVPNINTAKNPTSALLVVNLTFTPSILKSVT